MSNIENFNNGINISSILILFFLLILSFKNTDVSFISVNPGKFLSESIIWGLCAAIPYIAIGLKRGATNKQISSIVFIVFICFYVIHTLMELSGLNTYVNKSKIESKTILSPSPSPSRSQLSINPTKKIEYTDLEKCLLAFVIIIIIVLGYLAYITHDWPTYLTKKDIWIEIIIFTVLNTIPQIVITSNRNSSLDNIGIKIILSVIYYAIIYLILQSGGFFTNLFSNTADKDINEVVNFSEISDLSTSSS
jgi:hypothetical protein